MQLRIKPIPPAAYAVTMVIVYAAAAIGVVTDIRGGVGNAVCALVAILGGGVAVSGVIAGLRRTEIAGGALVLLGLTGAFLLAPTPDEMWATWDYTTFSGVWLIFCVRWRWLCRH